MVSFIVQLICLLLSKVIAIIKKMLVKDDVPFFSIIIPVYNCIKYIEHCLDSILKQSFRNFEVIVIDDCSTDGSAEICDVYSRINEKVIVFHLKKNSGVVKARDTGLQLARGKYIIWVDSDDVIASTRLEIIHEVLSCHDVDIVITGYCRIDEKGRKSKPRYCSIPFGIYKDMQYRKMKSHIFAFNKNGTNRNVSPSLWDKAAKRELYVPTTGKISTELRIGDDAPRTYVALALASSIAVIDDSSYFYRMNQGQMTKGYYKNYYIPAIENYLNIDRIIHDYDTNIDVSEAINQNICHVSAFACINESRNPDKHERNDILECVFSNSITCKSIDTQAAKALNLYSRLILYGIKKKKTKLVLFLGRLFFIFVH